MLQNIITFTWIVTAIQTFQKDFDWQDIARPYLFQISLRCATHIHTVSPLGLKHFPRCWECGKFTTLGYPSDPATTSQLPSSKMTAWPQASAACSGESSYSTGPQCCSLKDRSHLSMGSPVLELRWSAQRPAWSRPHSSGAPARSPHRWMQSTVQ